MPTVTKLVGFILLMIGIGTWLATGAEEITALIPAVFGAAIGGAGMIADRGEGARRHAMHAALALALLAVLATAPTALGLGAMGDAGDSAQIESLLTMAVCLVYLVAGVRSFVAARRD